MKKIMFTGDNLTKEERQALAKQGYQIDAYDTNLNTNKIVELINTKSYDGYILGGDEILDSDTISQFGQNLKVISFYGVGYEAYIDTIATSNKGILVANTPKTNTNAVAEHTIALILASTRNIVHNNNNLKIGIWEKEKINDLCGLTIGIIGMGAIGTQVARTLYYSFGANIIYYSRTRKQDLEKEINMRYVSLDELYAQSDIISLHCSLNKETENMIDSRAFSIMKDGVILINTSRAMLVNPKALYDNLDNNKIRTAAFDVFYKEPINLRTDKDFSHFNKFNNKQLVISPHTAYFSHQALGNMKKMAIQNCIDVLEGKKCNNVVNEIGNFVKTHDYFNSTLLENYNFYIVEQSQYYLDKIKTAFTNSINSKNLECFYNLEDFYKCKSLYKSDNKKIILAYFDIFKDFEKIKKIKNLSAICYGCTYLSDIDLEYCNKNDIIVTALGEYRADMRVDLIFYIIQSVVGRMSDVIKDKTNFANFDIPNYKDMKVGFLGYTELTDALSKKCKMYGMNVSYFSEKYRPKTLNFKTMKNILRESDIIITAGYTKEEQYKIGQDMEKLVNPKSYIISCEQEAQNINKDLFIRLAEQNKILGYGFTQVAGITPASKEESMDRFKGNVFILPDKTWANEEVFNNLCDKWVESVKSVLEGNAKDLAKL